jgi:hypothetical protein
MHTYSIYNSTEGVFPGVKENGKSIKCDCKVLWGPASPRLTQEENTVVFASNHAVFRTYIRMKTHIRMVRQGAEKAKLTLKKCISHFAELNVVSHSIQIFYFNVE